MIAIIASAGDAVAERVARQAPPGATALVTPADLSAPGWRLAHPDRDGPGLAVGGERLHASRLSGVLVRLAVIAPSQLPHVARVDRRYVAAEMTAFLRAWLRALDVPVLNPPSPTGLSGPGWAPERWAREAAAAGLPVRIVRRRIPERSEAVAPAVPETVATVVGERCHGELHPRLRRGALRLARRAGVALLGLRFAGAGSGAPLVSATPWPHLADDAVVADVLALLGGVGRA